ncbi:hypothetical protein Pmar_PMAR023127 [Perkinsus marinus ATCC 50983]|uniref:Uncharacterized protein n=1 Tax=Perkinsus marinus (strain ATCC 50983 / TXsc) TaxID=423536 RepID=C5LE47_PERM5|nr:hypothetical protein Pmar_PMAR023127 [Perkinsus marinus ATCC 50983]EER04987.1 hypothetical protein Pmar_PMAR023127 [Perkinsus marinus ATCC 50983]|eukprot:XP_002773171.1 hypothetical protein Pmar_PMAR023127 [Perkinsus marinus ATCC 50983]
MFISSINLIFIVLSFHNNVLGDLHGLFFTSKPWHTAFLVLNFRGDNTVIMVVANANVGPLRAHWEYVPGTGILDVFAIHLTQSQYEDVSGLFPLDYDSHTLYGVLMPFPGLTGKILVMSHGLGMYNGQP